MLAIECQAYSFEAGNVRHEHEWRVWQDVKLPRRQDHPAGRRQPRHQRGRASASSWPTASSASPSVVGRERVIAATDCGLGGRVHPQIAWAKLEALAAGARIASKKLWRR